MYAHNHLLVRPGGDVDPAAYVVVAARLHGVDQDPPLLVGPADSLADAEHACVVFAVAHGNVEVEGLS